MHGDIDQPQDAIFTKDDYENYDSTHRLFTENLKGDLVSKTFLFLGFSFTDPNIDYILSRIRVLLGQNQRPHYCIMRQPRSFAADGPGLADQEYDLRKFSLRAEDLKRFAIETVLIDEYSEITELLKTISRRAHQKNIFVSGSAREFGSFGEGRLLALARRLGREIIERGYNLVSGFGQGLGDQVILGALEGLYHVREGLESRRLIIRPFPSAARPQEQEMLNKRHREDLISQSGAAFFLCGNRDYDGQIGISKGLLEEYKLTKHLGRFPIPLGCTGYAAEAIWKDVRDDVDQLFPMKGVDSHFDTLGDPQKTDDDLIEALFAVADQAKP